MAAIRLILFALLVLQLAPVWAAEIINYGIDLRLDEARNTLDVNAELRWQGREPPAELLLNRAFDIVSARPPLKPSGAQPFSTALVYELAQPWKQGVDKNIQVHFRGKLPEITEQGVLLDSDAYWYPQVPNTMVTFQLRGTVPLGWHWVSQGDWHDGMWRENHPQRDIVVVAGPYQRYRNPGAGLYTEAWLLQDDKALADTYLAITGRFVDMYQKMLGTYPYGKFFMVENQWQTGFGFPSFTLLGSQVIRLPFIPYTSYPHEIVHNWWGNSVYVDYDAGNWSEGLTTYLADHLLKEQKAEGAAYRRDTLQQYADFVKGQNDFPLTAFVVKRDESSQAVGYGKSMMLFHMLRRQWGDARFIQALQSVYRRHQFKTLGFTAFVEALGEAAGEAAARDMRVFKQQWLERPGAPELRLQSADFKPHLGAYQVTIRLAQTQGTPLYQLHVPVWISMQGRDEVWHNEVKLSQAEQTFQWQVPAPPLRLAVDGRFDVFRKLHAEEIPPALSQLVGANQVSVILPSAADAAQRELYRHFAESWQSNRNQLLILMDDKDMTKLPAGAVWVFGTANRYMPAAAESMPITWKDRALQVDGNGYDESHSYILCSRSGKGDAVVYFHIGNPAAAAGLLRKLPHYNKYSYLVFRGEQPENVAKGQWPVVHSPLRYSFGKGVNPPMPTLPEKPLAEF